MYCYLLDKSKKEVIELRAVPDVIHVLNSLGIKYFEEFPYEAAGYEDPYSFMDDFTVVKVKDGGEQFMFEIVEE